MKGLLKALETINAATFRLEKIVLLIASLVMVVINFMQVLCRYVFQYSIPWSEQLSVVLFMLIVLIGGNIAMKDDGEIKIEVIKFKDITKDTIISLISDIISLITLIFLAAGSVFLVQQAMVRHQVLAALPIEYYHLFIVMLIGFMLMILEKITSILRRYLSLQEKK